MKEDLAKETAKKIMTKILDEAGIELSIGACGCCDSPWVKFIYKGDTIADYEYFRFSNLKEDKKDE